MPIYEYQCEACEHKLEKLQKISDEPLKECPQCEEPALNKLISAAAFRLSGGGWYETDFKTGKKKNVSSSDSSSSDSSSSSSSSDSDSSSKSSTKSSSGDSSASAAAS
jgi:putative FmdB family regulatory protein